MRKAAAKPRASGRRPQHVAAADEAKVKAAAAKVAQGDLPRTHVKCFYAGLQHGVWLAVEALASRASLAAAVSRAFQEDGVACSSDAATVVFVTADKKSLEFPGQQAQQQAQAQQQQQNGGGKAGEQPPAGGRGGTTAAAAGAAPVVAASGTAGGGGGGGKWEAAARSAVRVYVR